MSPAVKKRKTYSLRFSNIHETSGIRTPDNLIKSQVLYHLSYTPLNTHKIYIIIPIT